MLEAAFHFQLWREHIYFLFQEPKGAESGQDRPLIFSPNVWLYGPCQRWGSVLVGLPATSERVLMWSYGHVCSPRGPRLCSPVCAAGLMQKDHFSVENLFSVVPLIKGFYSEGAFEYQILLIFIFPSPCYLIWSCSKFSGPTHL